jgi:hypothetical protein
MKKAWAATAVLLLVSGCNYGSSDSASPAGVVGGWSTAEVSDDGVKAAANAAAAKLGSGRSKVKSIDSASYQVVAGTNYRIEVTLADGTRWQAVVWRKIDGSYEVTESRQI